MPYATTAKNAMLSSLGITQVSLHSADPGQAGANELAGGSPAYARKAIAFNAPANGVMSQTTSDPVFDVPAGATVAFVGYWAGATFRGSGAISPAESFASQGQFTLSDTQLDLNL